MNIGEQLSRGNRPATAVRRNRIGMSVSDQRKALGVACAPRRRPGHYPLAQRGASSCAVAKCAECANATQHAGALPVRQHAIPHEILDHEHRRDEDRACDVGEQRPRREVASKIEHA